MTDGANDNLGRLFNAPDAGTQGPGDLIRRAREAQRIPIEVMAANIKVTVAKLQALEDGRFADLPDANFTRALAMTVCRALKIDATAVLAGLPAARPTALLPESPSLNQPFKQSRSAMRLFDSSIDWSAYLRPQWLAPVGLLLAAVVLYATPGSDEWPSRVGAWFQSGSAAQDAVADAAAAASEAEAPLPTGLPIDLSAAASGAEATRTAPLAASAAGPAASTTPSGQPLLRLDAADAAHPASAPAAPPATTTVAAPVSPATTLPTPTPAPEMTAQAATPTTPAGQNAQLSLRASEPTWVEIRDGQGKRILGRLVQRDESVDMSAQPPLSLRIGNAKGMSMSYKGQPMDLVPYTRNNVARFELK